MILMDLEKFKQTKYKIRNYLNKGFLHTNLGKKGEKFSVLMPLLLCLTPLGTIRKRQFVKFYLKKKSNCFESKLGIKNFSS